MCNLYSVRASVEEVAAYFGATLPAPLEIRDEVTPGAPGPVAREGRGGRVLQAVRWGFPYPGASPPPGQPERSKPVNLVANLTSPMWDKLVPDPRYRCLIALTRFAEPEGAPGRMTRTWYSIPEEPIFAWAGFCRNTQEGPVYTGMTCDSNSAVAPLNPRMPVLLRPDEYDRWLHGSVEDVIAFQFRQYPADRLAVDRTDDLWCRGGIGCSGRARYFE
jgi:putative SOS response-associated peptidase YedK